MLRRMKVLLSVVASVLYLGLGSPVLASGIFEEREPLIDREDQAEELILRERLFGGALLSPFAISPFGLSPFGLSPFGLGAGAFDLFLINEAIEAREDLAEDLFEFGVFDAEDLFDLEDFDEFDDDDDDD